MIDPNDKEAFGYDEAFARECDDDEDTYEFDTSLG
jgi:hypothetical protein